MDVRCFSVVWIDGRCCVGNVCGPTGWVFPDQASESFFAHWSLINITIQTNLFPMSFQKKTQRNWFINHIITPALTSTLVWYCYFFWARYWMAKLNPGQRHPRKDLRAQQQRIQCLHSFFKVTSVDNKWQQLTTTFGRCFAKSLIEIISSWWSSLQSLFTASSFRCSWFCLMFTLTTCRTIFNTTKNQLQVAS